VSGKAPVVQSGVLAGLRRQHYGAILADPPWSFATRSDKGMDRSPENHYDCMTLDEIKAMPVHEIAAKDCILFMWIIDTHVPQALEVLEAWGFAYKTKGFNWVKLNEKFEDYPDEDQNAKADKAFFKGMGFWTRANPEDCWLATRGRPKRVDKGVRRLIVAELREHSRKPDGIYDRIEALVDGPYCELFARTARPGWDQAGNEVGKFGLRYESPSDEELAEIEDLV